MVPHLRMISTLHMILEYLRINIMDVTLDKHQLTSEAVFKENVNDSLEAKKVSNNTVL